MTHPLALRLAFALAAASAPALATQQSCGVFSPEFTGGGFDRSPVDFEVADLGEGARLLAAGEFTVAGSVQARRVAQWDGSAWAAVGQGFSGDVFDLELIDLGAGAQLYATGRFQSSGGQTRNRVARWDGSTWVALGSGLDNWGWALCEYPTPAGNRLVVAGEFTTAGGQPALRVAQWDGTSWSALGAGLGTANVGARVIALTMHDDGTGPALYAAGSFPGGVARFDGAQWTVVGGGVVGTVLSLASFDDGQGNRLLLAGGSFGTGPTSALKGWTGAAWQELGLSNYVGGVDRILVRQESSGPAAYLSGSFEPYLGATSTARLIARWTPSSITPYPWLHERVRAVEFFDGGSGEELFAGGTFSFVASAPDPELQRVARLVSGQWRHVEPPRHALHPPTPWWNLQGVALTSWTNPQTGERDLYIGGDFGGSTDDPSVRYVARWDGSTLTNVPAPISGAVASFCEWQSSPGAAPELVIGSASSIHSWDGVAFRALGTANTSAPKAMVVFTPAGATATQLYAFGQGLFPSMAGAYFAAQYDGSNWSPLPGPPLHGAVEDALVWDPPGALPEGIVISGNLSSIGGVPTNGLAHFDGQTWTALTGGGFSNSYELCLFDDGTGEALYANTSAGLLRFDGATWTSLGPVGSILEPHDDGSGPILYLSDRVRLRNGVQEPFGAATVNSNYPWAAHAWEDEHGISQGLFFTGFFESLGGIPAVGLARYWNPCGTVTSYCTAKVNSLGCTPQIGASGIPSASAVPPFVITAANVLNQKSGLLFFGTTGRITKAFQGGTLCVRSPVRRTPVGASGGSSGGSDCSGTFALDFTPYLQGAAGPGFNFGDTVDVQWWYRDPLASFFTGLTDALEFQVRP